MNQTTEEKREKIRVIKKITTNMILMIVSDCLLSAGAALLMMSGVVNGGTIFLVGAVAAAAVLAVSIGISWNIRNFVTAEVRKEVEEKENHEAILDSIPFPIHVMDGKMKWTYMNRAFEKKLVDAGTITNRESSYGMPCSTAGASICNGDKCGVRQLLEQNKAESYFDWDGVKCKQQTAAFHNAQGKLLGYVEIVTDLTDVITNNEYLEAEVQRLRANLNRIADGVMEIDEHVAPANAHTAKSREYFVSIYDSIRKVVGSIHTLNEESAKMTQAGRVGDLQVRCDETKLHGVYAEILHGMNRTFEEIEQPLNEVSASLSKVAGGELFEMQTGGTYAGTYANLIESVNQVSVTFSLLLAEVDKIVEAGRNGDFTYRGDSTKMQGSFAQIVDGMNEIFVTVSKPLLAVKSAVQEISMNNFTRAEALDYKGMLADLAHSIHRVRESFREIEAFITDIGSGKAMDQWIERLQKTGKRCENDVMVPAMISAMQSIKRLVEQSEKMATAALEGNLKVRGDENSFTGGYRSVISGMNLTMQAFQGPIEESSRVLQKVADGDLTVMVKGMYQGEYGLIKEKLNLAISSFHDLISNINTAANQVAAGSKQVSDASQALAQGATEQASSVEQLTASVTDVSSQTKQNAMNASQASKLTSAAHTQAMEGNSKMNEMLAAMGEINESSASISKIIKVIDDIAFQTNILALNAAVEAARVGQYGKGFAVVAEEVRNLASKSAQAAKETTSLIEGSVGRVEAGTKIANETAEMLEKIAKSVESAASYVSEIATASNGQATAISQIGQGITQVSNVVQTNSATAEESAASSEELSSQADMLRQMVSGFQLSDETTSEKTRQTAGGRKPAAVAPTFAGVSSKY